MAGTTDTVVGKSAGQNDGSDNRLQERQEASPVKASVESWQNNQDFNQFQDRRNALSSADKSLPMCTIEKAKTDTQCHAPAAQSKAPEIQSKAPEVQSNAPEAQSKAPDAQSKAPDAADKAKETPEQKETARQEALKVTLLDAAASPEKRLSAASDLVKAGVTSLKVNDKGVERQLRLEIDKATSPKDMVHVYANDERGKERVLLRGKDAGQGKFEQESDKRGNAVSFYGSWWSDKKAGKSVFADPANGAAPERATQERPIQERPAQERPVQERASTDRAGRESATAPDVQTKPRPDNWTEPQKLGGPMSMPRPNESRSERAARRMSLVPNEKESKYRSDAPYNPNDPFNLLPGGSGSSGDIGAARDMSREISAGMNQGRRFYQGPGDTVILNGAGHIDADGGTNWRNDRTGQANTSLRDARGRSLNAETRNFVAVPKDLYKGMGLKMGDAVLVEYNGRQSWGIIGDAGPNARQKWGEMSVHMAKELGINPDPNRGGVQSGVRYTFFKNSHHEKGTNPHSNAEAQAVGMQRLDRSYREAKLRRGA